MLKNIIKKYFSTFVYFYKYLGYRLFVVVLLSIGIGTLDAFGLTMFLPLLKLADSNESNVRDVEGLGDLSFIIDIINHFNLVFNLKLALLILFIFFLLKGIVVYFTNVYKVKVLQHFISTLRLKLTRLFSGYSFNKFVTSDVGRVQNSFTTEIARVATSYNSYSNCIQQIVMTIVYVVFVFLVDWKFAILVCLGGLAANLLYKTIYKKTKKESRALTKNNSNYQGLIIQYILNFKYLKATGRLKLYADKLEKSIKQIEHNTRRIGMLNAQISSTREPLLIAVVCVVIMVQVYFLNGKLASVLISLLFFYRALGALISFQNYYNTFLAVSGSLENVLSFEKELKKGREMEGNLNFPQFKQEIKIEDLSFKYNSKVDILKGINLSIQHNQTIAFVGESGSGKTTLVNVISGLLKPSSGKLSIDGYNSTDININQYQNRIGYISQEPVVFNDTIFNNVTFWAEPTDKNKERFFNAIKKASLEGFLRECPNGEYTILENNGINLSGGQKQRISIARELYKKIDLLILDEATSALDSETEKQIQDNIDALKGEYTIIIIAHRLSTIKNADKVYLMNKGEVEASGTFSELINKSERFKKMVTLQEV